MWGLIFVVVGVLGALIWHSIWGKKSETPAVDTFALARSALPSPARAQFRYAPDKRQAWAIDPTTATLYALTPHAAGTVLTTIPASEIIAADVYEDGDAITSRSAVRTVGGTLIGGALLGDAGAVVGGLSGDTRTTSTVHTIELRVTINDMTRPAIALPFLSVETLRASPAYQAASKAAREWSGRIAILRQHADGQARGNVTKRLYSADDSPSAKA